MYYAIITQGNLLRLRQKPGIRTISNSHCSQAYVKLVECRYASGRIMRTHQALNIT